MEHRVSKGRPHSPARPRSRYRRVGWFQELKNGRLIQEAESAGYSAFITADQGISNQQNLLGRGIAVLVIRSRTNQIEGQLPTVGAILMELEKIQPGQIAFAC